MKIHQSFDTLPMYCYDQIRKSITKGSPELRYLLVFDYKFEALPKYKNTKKLAKIFEEMYYSQNSIDLTIKALHTQAFQYYVLYRFAIINKKIINTDYTYRAKEEANKFFDRYLEHLGNNFESFKITGFQIPDVKKLETIVFFTSEFFQNYMNNNKLSVLLSAKAVKKEIQFTEFKDVISYIYKLYVSVNCEEMYFEDRLNIFHPGRMTYKTKGNDFDLSKDIVFIEENSSYKDIDIYTISYNKYMTIRENVINRLKSKQNEPK